MSNGILPVQSVRGTLREWIMNNAFPHTNLGAEFFNRLMNLCAYDYPMTPNLHGAVSAKFGEGVTAIIEGFSALEKPVFNTANRLAIRRIVPDEFYLEFLRLFDCSCCPAILGEYSDDANLPTDAQIGELAIVRYSDDNLGVGVMYYVMWLKEWDGAAWNDVVRVSATFTSGLATLAEINIQNPNWEVSVDSGATWDVSDHAFSPAVSSFPIWAKNIANGCIYTSVIEVPFVVEYCVSYGEIDASDFLFNFGTINGADASNPAAVLATYTDWEGNTNTVTRVGIGGTGDSSFYINMFYPSDSIPPVNFGLYSNDFTDPPVSNQVIPVSYQNCTPNCYQAVFNSTDLSTEGLTAISAFGGGGYDWGAIVPFDDPTAAAQNLSGLISAGFLEPSATLEYSFNGLEVTVTVCTVITMSKFFWGTNLMDLGEADFTLIP